MTFLVQHELAALSTTIITAVISAFVLIKEKNREMTRLYGIYTLGISAWCFSWLNMIHAKSMVESLFWARFLHFPAAFIPATFLHFAQHLLDVHNDKRQILLRHFFYVGGFFFISISFTKSFVKTVSEKRGFPFYLEPGPVYPVFLIFFIFAVLIIHILMLSSLKKERGYKKTQIAYVLGAYAIGYISGGSVFLPVFNFGMPSFSLYGIPICHLIILYTIVRYKAMDLSLLFRWGLAYFILILIAAIFLVPALIVSEWISNRYLKAVPGAITVIAISLFVFIVDPLRKKISHFVDQIIFRSPDFQATLQGLQQALVHPNDLHALCSEVTEKLKKIWGADHAGIGIWDFNISGYKFFPIGNFQVKIINQMQVNIDRTDFLVRTLESERRLFWNGVVVKDEITALLKRALPGEKTTFEKIKRTMRWLGADICVPLMSGDDLIGFILLGPKKNDAIYNAEDKKFLTHVVDLISAPIKKLVSNEVRAPGFPNQGQSPMPPLK